MRIKRKLQNINLNKFVFTNGSKEHVKNITTHLGIEEAVAKVIELIGP